MLIFQQSTPAQLKLSGSLDFDHLEAALKQAEAKLTQLPEVRILELSGLAESNSAVLSFLLSLKRFAHKKQRPLSFQAFPEKLLALVKTSHLDTLLCN